MVVKEEIKTMSPSLAYELGTMAYEPGTIAYELGYVTCLKGGIRLIWLIMYSGNYIVLIFGRDGDYKSKALSVYHCYFLRCDHI